MAGKKVGWPAPKPHPWLSFAWCRPSTRPKRLTDLRDQM